MKEITAVQWLMEQITYDNGFGGRLGSFKETFNISHLFEQAKKIEHTQIMDAYNHGYRDGESAEESTKSVGDISEFYDADDYFNKTYNNNHFPEVGNKVIEKPN